MVALARAGCGRSIAVVCAILLGGCGGSGGEQKQEGQNTVPTAPVISTHPVDTAVAENSVATFTVVAGGSAPLSYQWRKNAGAIAGAGASTLSLPSVAASDAGSYDVVVTNAAGSATSNVAVLTVRAALAAPTITTQPASQATLSGSSVTLSVAAVGNPSPSYRWQRSDGSDWSDIPNETRAALILSNAQLADNGASFRVVVGNSQGTVTSNVAVLTVNAAPTITAEPANKTVSLGASATFTVLATGAPAPAYQWQRSNNAGATWADVDGETQSSFPLPTIHPGDDGAKFRCVVSNSVGSVASATATLTITPGSVYYVATTGANSNPGTQAQPWKTMSYAVSSASPAQAGAVIYVKAGLYGAENVVFQKDGLSLIGYKTTAGDQPAILADTTTPFAAFDPAEQPLISGTNRASGVGIDLRGRRNITVKNISVANYAYGVIAGNSSQQFLENHFLFNVNVSTLGDLGNSYSGLGISLGSMGTRYSNSVKVHHSLIVNAAAEGLTVNGNGNGIDHVKVYCNDVGNANAATDYYLVVSGNDNVVESSLVYRLPGLAHTGHGFSIKSNAEQVLDQGSSTPVVNPENNLFRGNTAINMGGGFVVRHRGVRFNTFRDNKAYGTHTGSGNCGEGNGIVIRDGASNNRFENTTMENTCSAIVFNDTVEDGDTGTSPPGHPGNGNVIDGAVVRNSYMGVYFNDYSVASDAGANTIRNSSFTLTRYMHHVQRRATQMSYVNNSYEGTNDVVPRPGGAFRSGAYPTDVQPNQFTGCTYKSIEGGMPAGF